MKKSSTFSEPTKTATAVGASIRKHREALGMKVLDLANASGSDVGNISRIETGKQWPSPGMLERIAQTIGVDPIAFFKEWDNTSDSNNSGKVPLISGVSAGNWQECATRSPSSEIEEWVHCPVKHGKKTYALRVKGLIMNNPQGSPSFDDGDIIFVDPDVHAINKSLVIVALSEHNEATFKRLLEDGQTRLLEALNPSWPNRIINLTQEAVICGVVIAKLEKYL